MSADWTLLVGNPDDPWTARLLGQTPRPRLLIDPAAGLPDRWPEPCRAARRVVVHTATLEGRLIAALRALRRDLPPPLPFLLCLHPLNRYAQIEPQAGLFSDILPEATALEVLGTRLSPTPEAPHPAPTVAIVSRLAELGYWLQAACQTAGFPARLTRDWSDVATEPLAVWDLPVLDGGWEIRLRREARNRAVVVMSGFLDRPLVERLRGLGARACLDLPCSGDDLAMVLHRIASAIPTRRTHFIDGPSPTPPAPVSRRGRAVARNAQARFPWDG